MANKPPIERLEVLLDRNGKLVSQLDVQRRHVTQLEHRIEDLGKKEEKWQDTLLCVNRLWEELNSSIAFLNFRAGGSAASGTSENTEATDASLLQQRNPFLAKLVQTFLPDSKQARQLLQEGGEGEGEEEEGGAEGAVEIEGALRKRMAGTLEAAAQVLATIEELRSSSSGANQAATTSSPGASSTGAKGARDGSSREAQLAAMNNLLKAENNRLRDQALKDGYKMRQLSNSLADREDELLVAKRKFAQLKAASSGGGSTEQQQQQQQQQRGGTPPPGGGSNSRGTTAGPSTAKGGQQGQQGQQGGEEAASEGAWNAELARLRQLLDKRSAELEGREEALMKAEREVRDLRDRLSSEREAAARAKQYDQQRLALVNTELEKLAERSAQLHRDREHVLMRMHDLQFQAEKGGHAMRQLSGAEAHIADLESRVAALRATKAELEAQLLKERSRPGSLAALEEMKALLESLRREKATLQAAAARQKGASDRLEAAQQQAQKWRLAAEKAERQLALLGKKVEQKRVAMSAFADKERQWKERESDLRLFVEVTHSFVGDSREVGEVRAAEAKLQEQVADLRAQLEGHHLQEQIESLKTREVELVRQLEELRAQRAEQEGVAQALERQVEDLKEQLAAVKAESEEYINEIEKVGQAYEEVQAQNARLLAALGQREEDQARLLAESAAAAQERATLKEEHDVAAKAAVRAEEETALLRHRIAELEGRVQALIDELAGAKAEIRNLGARCEAAIQDLLDRDALLTAQRADLEAARKEACERAVERDTEHEERARERQRMERLQEELEEAQGALERARRAEAHAGGAQEHELLAECDALRKLINCNVCHQRQKDVVITKCWHMFCSECIRRNLETRHRKCPGCGTPFGQGDVKQFFFT